MGKIQALAASMFWEFVLMPLLGFYMIILAVVADIALRKWLHASTILCTAVLIGAAIRLAFHHNPMTGVGAGMFLYVFLCVLGERSHENMLQDNIYS